MKQLISLLAALAFAFSAKAQLVTATVTITNTPADGATLAIQGYTFLWTNGAPIGNFSVLITNTPGGDATNLATVATNAISQYGITVANGSSNVVQFTRSVVLNTSYTAGWASVVLTTNGGTPPSVLVSPIGGGGMTAAQQTNAISQHVLDLNADSTNALDQTAPVASQLVGLTNNQVVTGIKTFAASNAINGYLGKLTNGIFINPVFTNGQNYGAPFRSPGGGNSSEQFGVDALAETNGCIAFGDGAQATATYGIAIGTGPAANGTQSIAIGMTPTAQGSGAIAIGFSTTANGANSIVIGAGFTAESDNSIAIGGSAIGQASTALGHNASTSYENSTAIGQNATTTQTNQVALGISTGSVWIPGAVQIDGGLSNLTVLGPTTLSATATNALRGILTVPASSISTLVNSNNVLTIGMGSYFQLSGPTNSFFIAAINGGFAGRIVTLENATGQTMVIGNQSGYDTSTTTNRILTGWNSDRAFTNNPGCVTLWYDGTAQRWKITGTN